MPQTWRYIDRFEYRSGQPIKLMPIGKFKRGERELNITKSDLQQMAANHASGKPRWAVPLYFGHPTDTQPDPPKHGNIERLEVRDDGLYGYPDDEAAQALAKKKYQYISPGVIWSKNGSTYSDEHGQKTDNVLEHVAATNRPFFGRDVALFSSDAELLADYTKHRHSLRSALGILQKAVAEIGGFEDEERAEGEVEGDENADEIPGGDDQEGVVKDNKNADADKLPAKPGQPQDMTPMGDMPNQHRTFAYWDDCATEKFKDYNADQRREMAKKGLALPDGSYPIADEEDLGNAVSSWGRGGAKASDKAHIVKRAKALGATDKLPVDWEGSTKKESNMADEKKPETLAVSAEEFAEVKAKAAKADEFAAKAEAFAVRLAVVEKARRHDQIAAEVAEKFSSIPEKAETLAEKMQALEEKDPDLFKYFSELLETTGKALDESELLRQRSSAFEADGGETENFDAKVKKIIKKEFNGDGTKYTEAMKLAAEKYPTEYNAWLISYAPARGD